MDFPVQLSDAGIVKLLFIKEREGVHEREEGIFGYI